MWTRASSTSPVPVPRARSAPPRAGSGPYSRRAPGLPALFRRCAAHAAVPGRPCTAPEKQAAVRMPSGPPPVPCPGEGRSRKAVRPGLPSASRQRRRVRSQAADQTVSRPVLRSYWQRKPFCPASRAWTPERVMVFPSRSRTRRMVPYRSSACQVSSPGGSGSARPERKKFAAQTKGPPGPGRSTRDPSGPHSATAMSPAASASVSVWQEARGSSRRRAKASSTVAQVSASSRRAMPAFRPGRGRGV